jgi:two-component system sensor histidine kinase KdpD
MPYTRPDPEKLLRQIESDEGRHTRGSLKIFLGYASGVGKSFRMLDEARRRKMRGEDVVVAATQKERPAAVECLIENLESIRVRMIEGHPVLDMDAILRRHPQVAIIDGLAYDNPPGWPTKSRWQDVETLLKSGISVITSLNVKYVEELADRVAKITGRRASVTVPQSFLLSADEIVVVDAPVELEHQLADLREMALLLAADVVDRQLQNYLSSHGLEQSYGAQERILVCITPRGDAETMIRRGQRQAVRFHGEMHVCYVDQPNLSAEDKQKLDQYLALARSLGGKAEVLAHEDTVSAIRRHAKEIGATQIFVGHSSRNNWWSRLRGNPVERLILESEGIDVRVFPHA